MKFVNGAHKVNQSTDHELMLAVRDGDVIQLGVLFKRYQRPLYNFFLKLTGHPQTSEDLVQEVFCRILKYRQTYRGEGRFTTWLFQVARNARIDYFRKHHRHDEPGELGDYLVSSERNPDEILTHKSEVHFLKEALNRLSPEKREVLLLSRFQGLKYEEIAQITNCKLGTIKARVFRALKELSKIYMELANEKNDV